MKRDSSIVHKAMSAVRSEKTSPEMLLRRALWKRGCRYRVNCKDVLGKPDICIKKYRIAVFCDGDYWHGHNWALRGLSSVDEELAGYSPYWKNKIMRNMERDLDVTIRLRDDGWTVIRFWASDIQNDADSCVSEVLEVIERRRLR